MSADPTAIASHAYTAVFENEKIRILENRLAPGEKTELHAHPNHVGVAVTNSNYRFTMPDGQSMDATLSAGQALYLEAQSHATENIGAGEAVAILIELK